MSEKKLVIAHIGNGKSTNRYHLPFSLNRPDKIKIKSIYQRNLNKKSDWARIEGVEYTDDLEKILQDVEIDVVVVNTQSDSHYSMAKKVLLAGKHCVVEKPFATSVEDAAELFSLAKQKNVTVQCYQNRRFDSDFLTTQKVIESGRLGKIFEVCMHYDYYRAEVPESVTTYNRDFAFLYTHACHTVDQVLAYFGKPLEVKSDVRQLLGKGRLNDYFDLDFFYDDFKVSVQSSYFRAKTRPSFEVYGTRGTFIKAEQDRQEADLKKFYLPAGHADFGIDLPEHYGTIYYYDAEGNYHEEKVKSERGDYARFYDALYETIINGAPQLVTEEQTMEQMKILEDAGQFLQ